jgi:hypothetical protein
LIKKIKIKRRRKFSENAKQLRSRQKIKLKTLENIICKNTSLNIF